jgi:hypothetical protein
LCQFCSQTKPANETYFDNLFGSSYSGGVAALKAANVTTIAKVPVFDTGLIGKAPGYAGANVEKWSGTEKQEGILMLNDCTLAIGAHQKQLGLIDVCPLICVLISMVWHAVVLLCLCKTQPNATDGAARALLPAC